MHTKVTLFTILSILILSVVLCLLQSLVPSTATSNSAGEHRSSCRGCDHHTHRELSTISDAKRIYMRKKGASPVILKGRVRGKGRASAAGVPVILSLPDGREIRGITDENGVYSFELTVKGRIGITVRSGDYLAETRYIWVGDRNEEREDFSLSDEGRAVVEVVDRETEQSIPNAEVFLMNRTAKAVLYTFQPSYPAGIFVCEGVKKGWYILRVDGEGYVRYERLVKFEEKETRLRIALVSEVRITGVVVDERGRGIEGVRVAAGLTGRETVAEAPDVVVSTDREGRFSLKGLRPGETYIYAYKTGYAPTATENIKSSPGEWIDGLVLRLGRGATLRGRVVDERGSPVSGAEVMLSALYFHWHHPLFLRKTRTNSDGSFEIRFLADADYNITVNHKDYIPLKLDRFVSIRDEQDVEGIVVTLRGGVFITGRVMDSSGAPLSGVKVVVSGRTERGLLKEVATTVTNKDGSFSVLGLEEGTYMLDFWAAEYTHRRIENIRAPSENIEVTLKRRVSLKGSLLIGGVPASGVEVLLKKENMVLRKMTDEEGLFLFRGVEPGEYILELRRQNKLIERRSMSLESDIEVVIRK